MLGAPAVRAGFPGQFAGYAAANVAGVFAVAGWERRTGGEVLSDGRESLYVSR